ncbi:M48 family metallopeptidase [Nitrospira sp. Nam80]
MNTESREIRVSGLPVHILRKPIKNLHLGVYPPHGRVRVAAPLGMSDNAVRLAVISRLGWIKKQRTRFQSQERQSAREYVSRESHYYLGRRYLMNVVEHDGPPYITLRNKGVLEFHVPKRTTAANRERLLRDWYRQQLKCLIPKIVEKWEGVTGVKVAAWGVKKMKTKWGSCNSSERRIWLNLELAKKPIQCLEYIVVHEMVHLLERRHNDRFTELLDQVMPTWRLHRDELNRAPLGHESWSY